MAFTIDQIEKALTTYDEETAVAFPAEFEKVQKSSTYLFNRLPYRQGRHIIHLKASGLTVNPV